MGPGHKLSILALKLLLQLQSSSRALIKINSFPCLIATAGNEAHIRAHYNGPECRERLASHLVWHLDDF